MLPEEFKLQAAYNFPGLKNSWDELITSIENIENNAVNVLHCLVTFLESIEDFYASYKLHTGEHYLGQEQKDEIIKYFSQKKRAKIKTFGQLERLFSIQNAANLLQLHSAQQYSDKDKKNIFLKNINNMFNNPKKITAYIVDKLSSLSIPLSTIIIESLEADPACVIDPAESLEEKKLNKDKMVLLKETLLFLLKTPSNAFNRLNALNDLPIESISLMQLIRLTVFLANELDTKYQALENIPENYDILYVFFINLYTKSIHQYVLDNSAKFTSEQFEKLINQIDWGISEKRVYVSKNLKALEKFNIILNKNVKLKNELTNDGFFEVNDIPFSLPVISKETTSHKTKRLPSLTEIKNNILKQVALNIPLNSSWEKLISSISQIQYNHIDYLFCAENFLNEIDENLKIISKSTGQKFDDNDIHTVIKYISDKTHVKLSSNNTNAIIKIHNAVNALPQQKQDIHPSLKYLLNTLQKDVIHPYIVDINNQLNFDVQVNFSTEKDVTIVNNWLNIKQITTKFNKESELIDFGLRLINNICRYFIEHDLYENTFHRQHAMAEKIILSTQKQLLARGTPVAERFSNIISLLTEVETHKGLLHDLTLINLEEIKEFLPYLTPRKAEAYNALCQGSELDSRSNEDIKKLILKTPAPIIEKEREKHRNNLLLQQQAKAPENAPLLNTAVIPTKESFYREFLHWLENLIYPKNNFIQLLIKNRYSMVGHYPTLEKQPVGDVKKYITEQIKAPIRRLS